MTKSKASKAKKKIRNNDRKKKPAKPSQTAIPSVDEFMKSGLDSGSEDEEPQEEKMEESSSDDDAPQAGEGSSHKASLQRLQEQDPEFYQFLKAEDKDLLDFNASESSSEEEDEERGDKYHTLPKKLEVASDESEASGSEGDEPKYAKVIGKKVKVLKVTPKMVDKWAAHLQTHSPHTVHEVIQAFSAAVHETGSAETSKNKYKVEGGQVFNAIVRICVRDLIPAVDSIIKLPRSKDPLKPTLPSNQKNWSKVRHDLKTYFADLIQLMSRLAEASVLNVILKHIHTIIHYVSVFPKLSRSLIKSLIKTWSSGEETSRVLAFLSINRLIRMKQDSLLEPTLKQLYMSYVSNCKFTSPSALPLINFMQRSLVEVFAIDVHVAYQYAFVYIRQLAINLRNAITLKKKENIQAVYNWQFIHSLHLWALFLGTLHPNEVLAPLIYPLTQTVIGTIKLVSTARYLPLRFHCVRTLNLIIAKTRTFIPVLPFLLEVFDLTNFNKKHTSISFKPFNFACILKFSKAQVNEKSFREGLIDQLFELFMEHLHIHAHSIGFPELTLPSLIQLKQFVKTCKVANFTKQIKQIIDKIEETNKVITQRRKNATLNLQDARAVDQWEAKSKQEGTPISKYYSSWRKLRDRELQHEIASKEQISTDNIPTIDRKKLAQNKATASDKREFSELFESDSEDDANDENRFLSVPEKKAKKQKIADSESDQEYSDFDSDELEQLAASADEEDEDEDEDGGDAKADSEVEEEDSEAGEEGSSSDIPDEEDIVEDFTFSDED